MATSFTYRLTTSPENLLTRAKAAAKEAGARFEGTTLSGWFSGQGVSGEYQIDDQKIRITVHSKPWYAPWSAVEARVKEFFS